MKEQQNIDGVPVPEDFDIIDINDPKYQEYSEVTLTDMRKLANMYLYQLIRKLEQVSASEQIKILGKINTNLIGWGIELQERIDNSDEILFS